MPKLKPSAPDRPIVAFVAGAFRPPNHRHWQMISYFSDLVGDNGEVIVVVSNPKADKSKHRMNDGSEITTEKAIQVLEIFRDAEPRNNVVIMESDSPSPVAAVYGMITDPETISDSDVLVCCYKDDHDLGKWARLPKMVEEKNPEITLLDFNKFAFRRSYENYAHGISQLQRRSDTETLVDEGDALPDFLNDSEKKQCLKLIYGDLKALKGRDAEGNQLYYDEDGNEIEKPVNESVKTVDHRIEYDDYDEFVSEWSGYNSDLNVLKNAEVDQDKKVLTLTFFQPRKSSTLEVVVSGYNGDEESWRGDIIDQGEKVTKIFGNPFSFAKFISDTFGKPGHDFQKIGKDQETGMIKITDGDEVYLVSDCEDNDEKWIEWFINHQ